MSDWSDDESTPAPAREASPPRGGGGGRGRRDGPMKCYKCQEEGHMSRDCPNAESGGGGRGGGGNACFKCGEEGHMSRDCPSGGGGGGGGSRACYKCGEEGHMSRDCPSGGGGGGGGDRKCFKCNEEGHMSRDCPTGGSGGGGGNRGCFKCGEEGHMSRDCPSGGSGGGGGGDRSNACRKCGEEGHFSRDCPQNDGEPQKPRGCFNCGEEGHMSRDCTNERKAREPVEGEAPTERYVPPEMLEGDAIFEDRKVAYEGSGINFEKYESIPHQVTGNDVQASVETFEQLGLRPLVLENVKKCGYSRPTPIQKHGSPQLMAARHVMCCAQTGSGKTAAFLLPIINNLLQQQETLTPANSSPAKPEALILAPTRELAIQIGNEANMYSAGSIIKTCVVYGGAATFAQKARLMRGANIMVATTGRLKQFVKEGLISLDNVQFFILDEADRMLDMGFMPDVEEIVGKLPPKEDRVSGMFSATFASEIQEAAKKFLHDYIFIVVGVVGGACKDVEQEIIQIEKKEKRNKLMEILKEIGKETKVLIFCASKKGADFLATFLSTNDVSVTSIHGDRLQSQREQALREFTYGKRQVLVATAVAARGLDIPKVGVVINYDLPNEIDEYVHRIGRTGRVGHTGKAISFYDDAQDSGLAGTLVGILQGAGQTVPDFLGSSNGYGGGFEEGGFSSVDVRGQKAGGGAGAAPADDEDEW